MGRDVYGNIDLMLPIRYSTKPRYRPKFLYSAAILLLLISWAVEPQSAFAEEAEVPGEIEEVIVYGEKSLLKLKREVIEAEDNAFAVFNSLNKEHQYDIRCYMKAETSSHIKHRICFPNYVHDLEEEAASILNSSRRWTRLAEVVEEVPMVNMTKMKQKEKNLRGIMDALTLEHPELANALKVYSETKGLYVTESERRCKRLLFTCQD